jgi:hypothetical protein
VSWSTCEYKDSHVKGAEVESPCLGLGQGCGEKPLAIRAVRRAGLKGAGRPEGCGKVKEATRQE